VWSKEEDEAIRGLVEEFGTRSWSVIAEHIAANTSESVRVVWKGRWVDGT